ncbi:hypothetical protein GGI25_000053 [Coemansia spiralis]|uniref:Uncharacterized protein n=2 Tax=Coemansia TaxID=4863 RepID=A0A9W8G8U0_9FUNG|nr:hypothetical protein EDC05_002698 [Coemansia umbellata]KAJ2623069.1 hypothetical protein GGI26_002678 [Coemansia sp. RSA 1358]KAJ2681098.1 hypothetical protein GGI25_000053 [Coemansia spiralis]
MASDNIIPARNVDRVGGIIAAAAFGLCLLAHVWHMLRHKCYLFAATLLFLVFRVVGWLLAFIGAVRDDRLLNKRGYIVNAVAFWLLMLGSLLLLARWEACRRGARWGVRSWGGTGASLILCIFLGALDAAGQISWLNNPEDNPKVTLKIASIGFLVLACVNVLFVLFFNMREAEIYQRPSVRWAFGIVSLLIGARCVFWMLVGLHILHFDESQRRIFLFCLATIFEILVTMSLSFLPVAKNLSSQHGRDTTDGGSLKPESVYQQKTRRDSAAPVNAAGTTAAHSSASNSSDNDAPEQFVELSIPNGVTATGSNGSGSRVHRHSTTATSSTNSTDIGIGDTNSGNLHSSMPAINATTAAYTHVTPQSNYSPTPEQPRPFNPWAGAANLTTTGASDSSHNPHLPPYAQGAQAALQQQQYYTPQSQQQHQQQQQQASTPSYGELVTTMPMANPSVRFSTPNQSPYMNMPSPHTQFVKTPYPPQQMQQQPVQMQMQPHQQPQLQSQPQPQLQSQPQPQPQLSSQPSLQAPQLFMQSSNPAFTDDYFRNTESPRGSTQEQHPLHNQDFIAARNLEDSNNAISNNAPENHEDSNHLQISSEAHR